MVTIVTAGFPSRIGPASAKSHNAKGHDKQGMLALKVGGGFTAPPAAAAGVARAPEP